MRLTSLERKENTIFDSEDITLEKLIKKNKYINILFYYMGSFTIRFIGLFIKVKKNRVLLSSGIGKGIFDSPLVIYERLIQDPFFKDFEFIWAVKEPEKFKDEYTVVKIDSLKYFYYCLSSKIWITSVNIERGLKFKKKNMIYLNTWHGVPLKYVGLDVKSRHDYNFSHVDMFISSGDYEDDIYKHAFNLNDNSIFSVGNPRNIELYNLIDNKITSPKETTLSEYGLDIYREKKIILYAPTWKEYASDALDLNLLLESLDQNYVIFLKSHPLEIISYSNERVIDVSHVRDIEELLPVSDILISDYSSVMIDYSILKRPIISFAPDFEEYKSSRGLYVIKEDLAPNVFTSENEIINFILTLDLNEESQKSKEYGDKYLDHDPREGMDRIVAKLKKKFKEKS